MRRINYKSDIQPLLLSLKVDENQITVPDCDFIVRFYIEGYEGRHYDCSHIGGVWSNCEPSEDGTKLVCYINNQRLGIGELCAEFHYISPDKRYSDGSQKSVVIIDSTELGVELVEDNGDAVTEAAIDVTLPFIYRTAYEIARDHGYTGTAEDFYSALASVVGIADAENKRVTAEITRNANEQERIENEENRLNAESERVNAEAQRVRNEAIRGNAESDRVEQEEDRKAKFEEITGFIATVRANEGNRESNERERQTNEDTRITEEAKRVEAEKKRAAEFEQQKLDLAGKIDRSGDEMGGDLIFTDNAGVSFSTSDGGAHTMFNDTDDVAKFTAGNGDTFEFKQDETPSKNSSAVVVSANLYNALDMTLDSMGSALDGDAAYRAEAGDKIFNPDTCKIQRYNSTVGGFEDLCDPIDGKLYANKMTGYIYRWDTKTKKMVFVGGVKAYTKEESDSRFAKLDDATQIVKVKELDAYNSINTKSMWIGDEGLLLGGDGNGHLTVEQDEVITDVTLNGKLATKADDVAYGVEWNNGQPTGEMQETTIKEATKNTTVATLFLAQSFNALESEVEKKADKTELDTKVSKSDIVQSTGTSTTAVMSQKAVSDIVDEIESQVIYDVTANNSGTTFDSLSALLSNENLYTLIPSEVRCGGMSIRFVQSSDNKYVEYKLTSDEWSFSPYDWQGVDEIPTLGSNNLIKSGGVQKELYISKETTLTITGQLSNAYTKDGEVKISPNISQNLKLLYYQNQENVSIYIHIQTTNERTNLEVGEIFIVDSVSNLVGGYKIQNSISAPVGMGETSDAIFVLDSGKVAVLSFYNNNPYYFKTVESYSKLNKIEDNIHNLDEKIKLLSSNFSDFENNFEDKYGLLTPIKTANLVNPSDVTYGVLLQSDGHTTSAGVGINYQVSGYIPVEPNQEYHFIDENGITTTVRNLAESSVDAEDNVTVWYSDDIGSFTTNVNTHFVRFSMNKKYDLSKICLCVSTINSFYKYGYILRYDDGINIKDNNAHDLINKQKVEEIVQASIDEIQDNRYITFVKNGKSLSFTSEGYNIIASLDKNDGNYYGGNHIFNFLELSHISSQDVRSIRDDVAPAHVIGTTIGANHGLPIIKATIANHGLTNKDLGTAWIHTDGHNYYPVRIVDADNVLFMSDNYGTSTNQSYYTLTIGTLTNGNSTLNITAVTNTQLWPSVHNVHQEIIVDGKNIDLAEDGTYTCSVIDIIENYEVADPASVLNNIKVNTGSEENPTFDGDALFKVKAIYRFLKGCSVICFIDFIASKELGLSNIMFAQSSVGNPTGGQTFKYYIPGSNPINGYDFRQPILVNFGDSVSSMNTTTVDMADPTHPVNRIVTYGDNFSFAIGYLPLGVGKNLNTFTNQTFEIRGNSGKIYPHGVDTKVGINIAANDVFSAVMYRGIINADSEKGNRMSFYTIPVNDLLYVFVDYKGTMLDEIKINQALNGKIIQVVESRNVSLLNDMYNDGFFVKADYVQNDTCYIVLKIG